MARGLKTHVKSEFQIKFFESDTQVAVDQEDGIF